MAFEERFNMRDQALLTKQVPSKREEDHDESERVNRNEGI